MNWIVAGEQGTESGWRSKALRGKIVPAEHLRCPKSEPGGFQRGGLSH